MTLYERLIGFVRAYPLIILVASFIAYFLTYDKDFILLSGVLLFNDMINHFLKYFIFKPVMGNNTFPLIGSGKRPIGAKNCDLFIKSNASLSEGYGMPSGHSQEAVFFSTFVILNILDSKIIIYEKIMGILVFLFLAFGIMYSRVYLGCHTVQQVILGGLLGWGLGIIYYNHKDKLKNLLNI